MSVFPKINIFISQLKKYSFQNEELSPLIIHFLKFEMGETDIQLYENSFEKLSIYFKNVVFRKLSTKSGKLFPVKDNFNYKKAFINDLKSKIPLNTISNIEQIIKIYFSLGQMDWFKNELNYLIRNNITCRLFTEIFVNSECSKALLNNLPTHATSQQAFFSSLNDFIKLYRKKNNYQLLSKNFDNRNKDSVIWSKMVSELENPYTLDFFKFDSEFRKKDLDLDMRNIDLTKLEDREKVIDYMTKYHHDKIDEFLIWIYTDSLDDLDLSEGDDFIDLIKSTDLLKDSGFFVGIIELGIAIRKLLLYYNLKEIDIACFKKSILLFDRNKLVLNDFRAEDGLNREIYVKYEKELRNCYISEIINPLSMTIEYYLEDDKFPFFEVNTDIDSYRSKSEGYNQALEKRLQNKYWNKKHK